MNISEVNAPEQHLEEDDEARHLQEILAAAEDQLQKSKVRLEIKYQDILKAKQEQRENTVHQVGNLYSNDGFEELVALSQYADQVSQQLNDYEMEKLKKKRLEKVIQSPYFARIDFTFADEEIPEKLYIGRFTLTGDKAYDIKIYDWRSPISSVFYRYGCGAAEFNSPNGTIHGTVSMKRQYEIKDGELIYYFDCEMEIMDEFLKQLLAQNASKAMHAIVETIQKDQDVVIRDLTSDLMMVQGVAGSGKTSVALHRAAYLMYQGLSDKLMADNILIISPNSLFEQYISRVLPELGEENVVSYIFEDIIQATIKPKRLQTYREFLELITISETHEGIRSRSFEYKTSSGFVKILKDYVAKNPDSKNARGLYLRLLEELQTDSSIFSYSLENMNSKTLYYEDALCICLMKLLRTGPGEDSVRIKHVIIDEAQDYTPLHFEILKVLYPQASYTVLGDVNQAISRKVTRDYYEQIKQIMGKNKAVLVNMNKSFRCSQQILEFSALFLEEPASVESFCRNGDEPQTYQAESAEQLDELLVHEIKICIDKGYDSVALICENQEVAANLYQRLGEKLPKNIGISTVLDNSENPLTKVFTIPLYMAKGLEFDGVLVIDVSRKQHLYIACTRALHRLNVYNLIR